jgi:Spy/CpxP family protein refolding chaperone
MWHSSKRFLVVASVALNVAFVGVWLAHAIPVGLGKEVASPPPATSGRIWCPLHQQLGVSDEQWDQIEPRLKEFQQAALSVCQRVSALRLEMLELIAAPNADREAIAAKQEEIQAGQQKMQELVIGHLLAEKNVLTGEQQERLFALIRQQSGCDQGGPMMLPGPARRGLGRVLRDGAPSP